jgi:hypothetical protein
LIRAVTLPDGLGNCALDAQIRLKRGGQDRDSIAKAFSIMNDDFFAIKVNIFDTQAQSFAEAHAGPVK